MNKNKRTGSQAELNFIRMLAEAFDLKAFDNREFKQDTAQIGSSREFSRAMDARKIDVWMRSDVPEFLRKLAFQVKKKVVRKGSAPIDARVLSQIQVLDGELPVLVSHFRHKSMGGNEMAGPWMITMNAEDFIKLLRTQQDKPDEG